MACRSTQSCKLLLCASQLREVLYKHASTVRAAFAYFSCLSEQPTSEYVRNTCPPPPPH